MADVNRLFSRLISDTEPTGRDRGQLILVAALSLAILFVTLALILNTAIFTENLATRSGDIGGGTDAVRYHDAARDGVGGVIEYVNRHNHSSETTLQTNLSNGVGAFRNYSARLFAGGDRAVDTTLTTTTFGSRVAQTNDTRDFTNQTGNATNWNLAQNIEQTRAVKINVTDTTNLKEAGSGNEFGLIIDGSTTTWRLNITYDSVTGITSVGIRNGTGTSFQCIADSSTPLIDVTSGTVDGKACEGLRFAEGITGTYDIEFENADNVTGTYSFTVNDTGIVTNVGSNPDLTTPGSGKPFATHAVYSATISVIYETPRLHYEATVRVAPEEPADG